MEMCKCVFKDGTQIQSSGQLYHFLSVQNLKNIKAEVIPHGDVQVIISKILLKFKMTDTCRLLNYLWAQKLKNLLVAGILYDCKPLVICI